MQMVRDFVFFPPFSWQKNKQIFLDRILCLLDRSFINSGNDDKAALGLRDANAVPSFAPFSQALPGFFKTFSAILLIF